MTQRWHTFGFSLNSVRTSPGWPIQLATGNVPELETELLAIGFHLVAELATAVALILAGIGLMRRASRALPVTLLALGMLLYTVINSPGVIK